MKSMSDLYSTFSGRRSHKYLLCFVLLSLSLVTRGHAEDAGSWTRRIIADLNQTAEDWHDIFRIEVVRYDSDHLTGIVVLRRGLGSQMRSHFPVTLKGIQTGDGRFWPVVTAQVSDNPLDNWKTIGQSPNKGRVATRTVREDAFGEGFFVDLDTFRPLIGKVHYGRLLFQNGEAAILTLENLLPPDERDLSTAIKGWSRASGDLNHLADENSPFVVLGVSSEKGHLHGEFMYGAPSAKLPDVEDMALSVYRNFWPAVVAQVANDDRSEWRTIGDSSNPELAFTPTGPSKDMKILHVDLDVFRPMIGKFRYGRAVLKTGESAIFELEDLLPPEEELKAREHGKRSDRVATGSTDA